MWRRTSEMSSVVTPSAGSSGGGASGWMTTLLAASKTSPNVPSARVVALVFVGPMTVAFGTRLSVRVAG